MNISPTPAVLPNDFYVYLHRKATSGEVFYVGKGCGNRAWFHSNRSQHWRNVAKKHGVIVSIFESGLREWAAHEIECEQIALYGRMDCGYGKLVNKSDGGEGISGRVTTADMREKFRKIWLGKKRPPELIAKMVAASIAKTKGCKKGPMPEETKRKLSLVKTGTKASPETRAKMSAALKGRKCPKSPEHRAKISAAQIGRPREEFTKAKISAYQRATHAKPIRCLSSGLEFDAMADAVAWLKSIGAAEKPNHSHIRECCLGKRKSIYGHKWEWIRKSPD